MDRLVEPLDELMPPLRVVKPNERYTPPKEKGTKISVSKALACFVALQHRMDTQGMTLSEALRDFADYVEQVEKGA